MSAGLPRVLFFNINGNGTGHLSRCLAYARRMKGRARPVFLSLASALEIVEAMGFEADYFVSPFWSSSHINAWNRELSVRTGMLLESVRPHAVVFDGTWPFHGFMDACDTFGVPVRVWSNRGLHKPDFHGVPVSESLFDLVLQPGEIGDSFEVLQPRRPGRKVRIPPVTMLDTPELLNRDAARRELGLERGNRYALFSLGPGNLKDVGPIAAGLLEQFRSRGFTLVWAKAPITVKDHTLPDDVLPISVYPLVRTMRAFDVVVGAAGYNTCNEVLQAGVPALLVPNALVADDQAKRAGMVAERAPVVVSPCETHEEQQQAVDSLLDLHAAGNSKVSGSLDGARHAADEILQLVRENGGP